VCTPITPGIDAASLVSMELMRPCATDERTYTTCAALASSGSFFKSSTYSPPTVRNFGSSLRRTRLPRMLPAM